MDFPPYELKRVEVTEAMENAIGFKPLASDERLVYGLEREDQVINAQRILKSQSFRTAYYFTLRPKEKKKYDCVSRTFAPKLAVDEDPGMRFRPLPSCPALV